MTTVKIDDPVSYLEQALARFPAERLDFPKRSQAGRLGEFLSAATDLSRQIRPLVHGYLTQRERIRSDAHKDDPPREKEARAAALADLRASALRDVARYREMATILRSEQARADRELLPPPKSDSAQRDRWRAMLASRPVHERLQIALDAIEAGDHETVEALIHFPSWDPALPADQVPRLRRAWAEKVVPEAVEYVDDLERAADALEFDEAVARGLVEDGSPAE